MSKRVAAPMEDGAAFKRHRLAGHCALAAALFAALMSASMANAGSSGGIPEIRLSDKNAVPACVTPARLMAFLKSRNPSLPSRYESIADWYQRHGEAWRVRWDYAFFQMAIETNFLSYRQGNGRWGDVNPNQYNFAGIGTTGGGVPGDGFADVGTGVLAQIQHLVAYSGERVEDPVAPRTRLKQDDIIEISRKLNRPVRFSDLSHRWAVDRKYGQSIEWVAARFRDAYCRDGAQGQVAAAAPARETLPWARGGAAAGVPEPMPAIKPARALAVPAPRPVPPSRPAAGAARCRIETASYGGTTAMLIRSGGQNAVRYTVLIVLDGFEQSMASNYIAARAPGGETVGAFPTRDEALARARELCPGA